MSKLNLKTPQQFKARVNGALVESARAKGQLIRMCDAKLSNGTRFEIYEPSGSVTTHFAFSEQKEVV